jgi:hypothetical protein
MSIPASAFEETIGHLLSIYGPARADQGLDGAGGTRSAGAAATLVALLVSAPRPGALLVVAIVVGAVVLLTWYGRLGRCQAALAAWARIRAAFVDQRIGVLLVDRSDPQAVQLLEATGVLRTEAAVRRYCDAPIWEWWG